MTGIFRLHLAHGLIVILGSAINRSLYLREEVIVQARCTIILTDSHRNNAISRHFKGCGGAICHPLNLRFSLVSVANLAIGKSRDVEGCAIWASLRSPQHAWIVAQPRICSQAQRDPRDQSKSHNERRYDTND